MTLLDLVRAVGSKLLGCNLHAVEEGRVYRVARGRVSKETFLALLADLKIRTALDLRRTRTASEDALSPDEIEATGVRFFNVHLRSSALPLPSALSRFVEILDGAEYPVLFYCKRGTDKTGFAALLYRMLVKGEPLEQAREELAFLPYGHKKRRHEGPWHFMRLLTENGMPADLRAWTRDAYPALFARERPGETDPEVEA